jgi:hypothetical protein
MVETIPELSYGKIVARLVNLVGDSAGDPDKYPDAIPVTQGTIVLKPPRSTVRIAAATPVPVTAGMASITCTLDASGYLTFNGDRFVWGIATDDPDVNPHNLPWHVEFNGLKDVSNNTIQIEGFDFYLPTYDATANGGAGNAVDLTTVAPLTTTPEGVIITKGDKGDPGPGFVVLHPADPIPVGTPIPSIIVRLTS